MMVDRLLIFTDVLGPLSFANEDRTAIKCRVVFPHLGPDPVPFTASAIDPGWSHGELIFEMAAAGQFGEVAPYLPPDPAPGEDAEGDTEIGKLRAEVAALKNRLHSQGLEVDDRPAKASKA